MQSLKNFSINELTQSIILNNGQQCAYNPKTLEFDIIEEPYVLFQCPTTLRHHTTIFDYTDELFYQYAIIPCKTADTFLELVAGLCAPHISLPRVVEENRKNIVDFIESFKNFGDDTAQLQLQTLECLMKRIPIESYDEFLNFRKQTRTVILHIPERETRSDTMTMVCDFLVKYVSYDKSLLEFHSISITPYIVYNLLIVYCMMKSILHIDFPLDISALTSHMIMSMIIDIVIDRWSIELIIKGGNTSLRAIYQDLKQKCVALTLPSKKWTNLMIDKVRCEVNSIPDLFPHVLYYHLHENERFYRTWATYKQTIKNNDLGVDTTALLDVLDENEILNQCNDIALPLKQRKSLYTTESLIKLLESPIFRAMFPVDKHL